MTIIEKRGDEIIEQYEVPDETMLGRFQSWADTLSAQKMPMRTFCDGEPYFNFSGTIISFSQWVNNFYQK